MNFGAVAYLNMLPFFHDNKEMILAKSPRELNAAAREGDVDCACMSAIAGIRAGFAPVFPFSGVGSEHRVRSVYLEALPVSQSEGVSAEVPELPEFWGNFCKKNKDFLQNFTFDTKPGSHGRVHVFTAGASEHSEWLACMLLWTQGYAAVLHRIDASLNFEAPHELAKRYERVCNGEPAALLVIGDPALARARRLPQTARCRLDLATLWNAFSNLPCIFAAWFDTRPAELQEQRTVQAPRIALLPISTAPLVDAVAHWNAKSDFARWCVVRSFLEIHSPALLESYSQLGTHLLRDDMLEYLSHIVCIFDGRYEQTYELYVKFNAGFSAGTDMRVASKHGTSHLLQADLESKDCHKADHKFEALIS